MSTFQPTVVRIDVKRPMVNGKRGSCRTITVDETNNSTVANWVKSIFTGMKIQIEIDPTQPVDKTNVTCYQANGDAKGKSSSFTLYGIDQTFVYDEIWANLER
jgi:hypothetical protein